MMKLLTLGALVLAAPLAAAQSNVRPGLDVRLQNLGALVDFGREGVYPDGRSSLSVATTVCNGGTVEVPWRQVMDPAHPFIAFLMAKEAEGRFVQFHGRSFVKHGYAAMALDCGTPCSGTDLRRLGIGCRDTYSAGENGNGFWLGPPDEIDPWTGTWDPICSHFDRGVPAAATPLDCDGVRSLSFGQVSNEGVLGRRMVVADHDLDDPGARFFVQGYYVVSGEADALRENSLGSREFTPTFNGTRWSLLVTGGVQHSSILQRWQGAEITSASNGADDGRVYVGFSVTGPVDGRYRYEYAFHNRDNGRGIGELRVPICSGARVFDPLFLDLDDDPSNDWSIRRVGNELVVSGPTNPLLWNSIYNLGFESDAAPGPGLLGLVAASPGPGANSFSVGAAAPLRLFNVHTGPGCAQDEAPDLFVTGTPARATLGNSTFALESRGNVPGEPSVLLYTFSPGPLAFLGCELRLGTTNPFRLDLAFTGPDGRARHPVPVPPDLAFEGLDVYTQILGRDPTGAPLGGLFELSEGLRVRVGDLVADCP